MSGRTTQIWLCIECGYRTPFVRDTLEIQERDRTHRRRCDFRIRARFLVGRRIFQSPAYGPAW